MFGISSGYNASLWRMEMFNLGDKVLYGNGPLQFVGVVAKEGEHGPIATGVEIGCLQSQKVSVTISGASNWTQLDDATFERLTLDEPAFADSMSKERFMALQSELESLELSIAKGEETDETDGRIMEIEALMDNAPWYLCPDDGCLAKSERDAGASH